MAHAAKGTGRTWVGLGLGLVALVIVTLVLAGTWLAQYLRYREEQLLLAQALRANGEIHRALEATEAKSVEFHAEVAALADKLAVLRGIVPAAPDEGGFVDGLRGLCREHGVELKDWAVRTRRRDDLPWRTELALTLTGSASGLAAVGQHVERGRRLATWGPVTTHDSIATAVVTLYTLPGRGSAGPRRGDRMPGASRVWVWPYTGRVRAQRDALARLQAAVQEHASTLHEVDQLEARRQEFQLLVGIIETVRSQQGKAPPAPAGSPT